MNYENLVTIEKIREKLINSIKQSQLTQKEIADKLGIKRQQISAYIHEKKMPALDTLANLCEILDLDANEILCIHEYAKNN